MLALVVLAFYALLILAAAVDFARMAPARRGGSALDRRSPRLRLVLPFALAWIGVQSGLLVLAVLTGDGRASNVALLHLLNGVLFLLILPAGMHFANSLGRPALPLAWVFRRGGFAPGSVSLAARTGVASPRRLLFVLFAVPVAFSVVLFLLFPPEASPRATEALSFDDHHPVANALLITNLLLAAPFVEEIIYRHYIQTRLAALLVRMAGGARRTRLPAVLVAIAATTALFSLSHTQMLVDDRVKYLQIGVLGGALGWCQWRLGTECAIMLHYAFNFAMIALVPVLLAR